jgi:hypothetical protein
MMPVRSYFRSTSSPLFGLLAVLPLALVYEVWVYFINQSDITGIRNGADILLKQLLSELGFWGLEASLLLFFSAFIIVSLVQRIRFHSKSAMTFHFSYLPLMILESFIYAAAMILFFQYLLQKQFVMNLLPGSAENIAYSLGAGVYEELVFRAIVMQGLFIVFRMIDTLKDPGAWMVAALLSSLIFVMSHYIGEMSDPFTTASFILRFIGSIFLSILYIFRGFGVAAYTHAIYDILILV